MTWKRADDPSFVISLLPRSKFIRDLFALNPTKSINKPRLPKLFLAKSREQNCYEGKLIIYPITLAEFSPKPYSLNLILRSMIVLEQYNNQRSA